MKNIVLLIAFISLSFATKNRDDFVFDLNVIMEELSYEQKKELLKYQESHKEKKINLQIEKEQLQEKLQGSLQIFPVHVKKVDALYLRLNRVEQNLKQRWFRQVSFLLSILEEEQFEFIRTRVIDFNFNKN